VSERGSGTANAASELERLLALLPYLRAHPGQPLAETAAAFGITEAALVRDIELLFVCGLPGYFPDDLIDISYESGEATVHFDAGLSRPLRFTGAETLALIVALRTLAGVPGLEGVDSLRTALEKLETAAGREAEATEQVTVTVDARPDIISTVQQAIRQQRRLHLRYYVESRDESTDRDVDPSGLHLLDGRTYLQAWCHEAAGWRLFRLDRVITLDLLDEPATPPSEPPPVQMETGAYQPGPADLEVVLDLSPQARWVAEYYDGKREERPDGSVRFTLRTGDVGWVCRLLLKLGGAAVPVAPPDLAERTRGLAQAALAEYDAHDVALSTD
jgi:proteasome accessory factor C